MTDEQRERYENVDPQDVVEDAIEYFDSDEDEPAATEIPEDMPPPPNA
jgi:hypothetical protein